MKIDYNKFPVLQYIKYGNFNPIICMDDYDEIKDSKSFPVFREHYNLFQKVFFISKAFYNALDTSRDKLWDLIEGDPNFIDDLDIKGTYINIRAEDGVIETYCFYIDFKSNINIFYYFQGDKLVVYNNGKTEYVESGVVLIDSLTWNTEAISNRIYSQFSNIVLFHLFEKYAEIETRIISSKTKLRRGYNCIDNNKTDLDITYLNSKWFTNLIKQEGFQVRGHFRLQPYHDNNGLPAKKLIWINEFQKKGYTAPAQKIRSETLKYTPELDVEGLRKAFGKPKKP